MYIDIQENLNRIEERINHPDFMKMDGAANEVGYYIFDYDPQYELQVRATVRSRKEIHWQAYVFYHQGV